MKRSLHNLFAILFLYVCFFTVIQMVCFDMSFYHQEYDKLHVAQTIKMSEDDLINATEVLLDYTQGKTDDLTVFAEIDKEVREVFNEKEKAHMVDVRNLYLNSNLVKNISFLFMGVLLILIYFKNKKDWWLNTIDAYNKVSLWLLLIIGVLIFWALLDFTTVWVLFHKIFFVGNDLWILNPQTDILIMMVPEQFFYDLVMKIIIIFTIIFTLTNAIGYYFKHKTILKHQKEIGENI